MTALAPGWIITLTVLWVIVAPCVVVVYGALMMDPAGQSMPDGLAGWVYGTAALLVVYVLPLYLAWSAHARGTSLGWCLLYVVPHVLTVTYLAVVIGPPLLSRRTRR